MRNSEDRTYLQCTNCGEIYQIDRKISMEKIYVNSYCPYCNHTRALNCGQDKADLYIYSDPVLDKRYYNY